LPAIPSRVGDRDFGFDPRRVLELVHHVSVSRQRQPRIVPELASEIDDAPALVQQQRSEAMPQVMLVPTSAQPRSAPLLCRHLIPDLGLDVAQTSRFLGHASPTITLNVYTHLFEKARPLREIRARVAASPFAPLLGPRGPRSYLQWRRGYTKGAKRRSELQRGCQRDAQDTRPWRFAKRSRLRARPAFPWHVCPTKSISGPEANAVSVWVDKRRLSG
jgi:hypothetical protein